MSKRVNVTVFIPTYNGETYFADILQAIFSQRTEFIYEVLIIDSGSTDKTLSIITGFQSKHDNLRLHTIPNHEYGHGKTRNLAAQMATGEFILFLSHDAIPASPHWIYEMVKPFQINPDVMAVLGKQVPRAHCIPMLKSEIIGTFANLGPDLGTTLFYKDYFVQDQGTYDFVSFYSDANSAARTNFIKNKIAYKDVSYAEDQLFARDVINAGYMKAYAARGAVIHSNDLRLNEYAKRMYDETVGLRNVGVPVAVPSLKTVTKLTIRGIVRDTRHIVRDRQYSWRRKLYWLLFNPLFHFQKWKGVRRGASVNLDDNVAHDQNSLESSRKDT